MILFIEDESRQNESYREEFEMSGYQVVLKRKVDEALAFLREQASQIQLVILDVMMPPGEALKDVDTALGLRSGLRLFEKIRQEVPGLPVIVLTNVTDQSVRDFFMSNGVPYLQKKNYDTDQLVRKAGEILGTPNQ